ncbi:sodium:solute symporter family protein [Novosphingobium profundi]|uniref:sodium:solute symporter family protein n=1 Tax=Novosphingobium profundi TaxID=1774954 RepID=UPI001FEAC187|nr:sodium:solute symporter family protein [Novosphingobium profundi]
MIQILTLAIVLGTVAGAFLYSQRQARARTITEWAVGGRRFGILIFWFLNAGEIYTTFAVMGISGFAWAYGAPAYLALTSVSLSAVIGYWLMPRIWSEGHRHDLVTQADFFAAHYRATWLSVVVAIAGILALIVYVQIQITALGLILRLTLGHDISPTWSSGLAALLMVAFVFLAGLRSAAFAAGVKDVLMLVVVVLLCASAASRIGASSMLDIFARVQDLHPGIGSLPGRDPQAGLGTVWLMTSSLNVALGNWVLPHLFQLCYSAGSRKTIRRNAVLQPLYSLSYIFIIMLGFAALLADTRPPGGDGNAVLISFVSQHYPAWIVGLFAGTACLLALVPGSVLLLTAGSLFARNVLKPFVPHLSARGELLASRLSLVVFAAVAVWLTLGASRSLVEIGLSAYAAVGMLAPGVYLAFLWKRANALGVFAGMVAGYLALLPAFATMWGGLLPGWETGLVAMIVNVAVAVPACLLAERLSARPRARATTT